MSNYVKGIVEKYSLSETLSFTEQSNIYDPLCDLLDRWAYKYGYNLTQKKISGSRAKGTAISICSDMDIFASISSTTNSTLSEIYNSLFDYIKSQNLECRKQNVSIGVVSNGKRFDLVPGKRQDQYSDDHSLWVSKKGSWTKTNITTHISTVRSSKRSIEIKATKLWRERHKIDFPSFYLELAVIEATRNLRYDDNDNNFLRVLEWLGENIVNFRAEDPANTNNIISEDLTFSEKKKIESQAKATRQKKTWGEILW